MALTLDSRSLIMRRGMRWQQSAAIGISGRSAETPSVQLVRMKRVETLSPIGLSRQSQAIAMEVANNEVRETIDSALENG